jgi:hypothetical protein
MSSENPLLLLVRPLIAMLPVIVWQGWETLEEAREKPSEDQ